METWETLKWLHILSATILFGTGIGTAFQMVRAMATRRVETIHSVASAVVLADWLFTVPAGVMQPVTGVLLAWTSGYPLGSGWLLVTYALYLVALACWLPVVVLQIRIRDLAAAALAQGAPLPDAAWRAYRWWFLLGWPAFASLVGVFWLMVAKPDFAV
jgi:uncharacterized membrane protein